MTLIDLNERTQVVYKSTAKTKADYKKNADKQWDNGGDGASYTSADDSGSTFENKVYFTNPNWIGVGGANKEGKMPSTSKLSQLDADRFKDVPKIIEFNWKPKVTDTNKTNPNPVTLDDSVMVELEKIVGDWKYVIVGYKYGKGFPQQNKPLLISISNDPSDLVRGSTQWKKLG